jgi:hypothetical protein
VFSEPQVASVGTAEADHVLTAVQRIEGCGLSANEGATRPGRRPPAAGTNESVIVGAVALGPVTGKWIGQLTLVVRARTPIEILPDISLVPFASGGQLGVLLLLEERLWGE